MAFLAFVIIDCHENIVTRMYIIGRCNLLCITVLVTLWLPLTLYQQLHHVLSTSSLCTFFLLHALGQRSVCLLLTIVDVAVLAWSPNRDLKHIRRRRRGRRLVKNSFLFQFGISYYLELSSVSVGIKTCPC